MTFRQGLFVAGSILLVLAVAGVATLILLRLQEREHRSEFLKLQTFIVVAGGPGRCAAGAPSSGVEALDLPGIIIDVTKDVMKQGAAVSSEYITKAARDTSSPLKVAELPIYLYSNINTVKNSQIPTGLGCIIIANGHLGDFDTRNPPSTLSPERQRAYDPEAIFLSSQQDGQPYFALRALHLDDFPLSYFEFRLVSDPTNQYFKFDPSVLYFREPITALSPRDRKQVEITFTVHLPTSNGLPSNDNDQKTTVLQTSVTITDMSPGSVAGVLKADGTNEMTEQSRWFPIANLPRADDIEKVRRGAQGKEVSFGAANLRVTYKENDKTDLLLQYIGEALGTSAKDSDKQTPPASGTSPAK